MSNQRNFHFDIKWNVQTTIQFTAKIEVTFAPFYRDAMISQVWSWILFYSKTARPNTLGQAACFLALALAFKLKFTTFGAPSDFSCVGIDESSFSSSTVRSIPAELEGSSFFPELKGDSTPEAALEGDSTPEAALEGDSTPEAVLEGDSTPEAVLEGDSTPEAVLEGDSTPGDPFP